MGHTDLPKCGAYARSTGKPCRQIALANGRCHYHGGSTPIKHGKYTKQAIRAKRKSRQIIKEYRKILKTFKKKIQ